MCNAEEGLLGGLGIGKIVREGSCRLQFGLRRSAIEGLIYSSDTVVITILTHVQIHAAENTESSIFARIACIATARTHQVSSLAEVFYDLIVHFSYRSTLGLIRSSRSTQGHTQIVTTKSIRLGKEGYKVEMHKATHEVSFAQQLVAFLIALVEGLNNRVGHVDNLVCNHPESTHVLQTIVHHVSGSLIERVSGVSGQADVVSGELRHLHIVANVAVGRRITQELHFVFEHCIATIHNVLCTLGVLQQNLAAQLITGNKIHFATAETEHRCKCYGQI